jgi:hypothetical protein
MRRFLKKQPTGRNRKQRGGAYTFTVIAASGLLMAMGGSFVAPAQQTVYMNSVRYHKLVSQSLVESGLEWALTQKMAQKQTKQFELSYGTVDVTIAPKPDGSTLVVCQSHATKARLRGEYRYSLKATVKQQNGKNTVTKISMAFLQSEKKAKDQ